MAEYTRCEWPQNLLAIAYHDQEWGVPVHDDRLLFEFLILEGAQAGLSWDTVLKKRSRYQAVFDQFVPDIVAGYDVDKQAALLQDPGIIRNRLKIKAAVQNAQAFLRVQEAYGSFDAFIWQFVDGQPIIHHWQTVQEYPVTTPVSDAMSKALRRQGFNFVGSTICYAYMQAVGMVNDHVVTCFRHAQLS